MANAGFRITGTTKLFHTHTGQFNCPAPLKNVKPPFSRVVFSYIEFETEFFYCQKCSNILKVLSIIYVLTVLIII